MATRIEVYKQRLPPDIIRDNPSETWRCDIVVVPGWESHHGVGVTEHEAILNAAVHYFKYQEGKKKGHDNN